MPARPQWWLDQLGHRIYEKTSWVIDSTSHGKDGVISFMTEPGVELTTKTPTGDEVTLTPDQAGRIDINVSAFDQSALLLTAHTAKRATSAVITQIPPMRLC